MREVTTGPVSGSGRVELLDVFRGFAIFGIFIVNIEIMNCVFQNQGEFGMQWSGGWNSLADRLRQLFFYTKFFPIFSFMFGLGIAIQALNRLEKGSFVKGFFIRRMTALFVIGWIHILFLWSGDVVHLYAVLGFFTAALLRVPDKVLLITSLVFLLFPFYDQLFNKFYEWVGFVPQEFLVAYDSERVVYTLRSGAYFEGIKYRFAEYFANIPMLVNYLAPLAFSMFLLGLWFGKNKLYTDITRFVNKFTKPVLIVAILSNAYRIFFLFVVLDQGWQRDPDWGLWLGKLMVVCDVLMGMFYLWLIGWLWRFETWKHILRPFTFVGRMALTNYLFQSMFGMLLFSSLGFSFYQKLSPWETFFAAVLFFVVQAILSKLWLSLFKFGPAEWLWRCVSYKKWFPIRK